MGVLLWSNILWADFFVTELHRENEVDTLLRALLFTLVPIAYDAQMSLALLAVSNLLATISTTRFRLPHLSCFISTENKACFCLAV